MEVEDWLRSLGLAQYETVFREHDIEVEVLPELTEADLERLGAGRSGLSSGADVVARTE